jgi:hypothetical protein
LIWQLIRSDQNCHYSILKRASGKLANPPTKMLSNPPDGTLPPLSQAINGTHQPRVPIGEDLRKNRRNRPRTATYRSFEER